MPLYDFYHLNKAQQTHFNNFLLKLSSQASPLSYKDNEEDFRICFENELNALLRDLGFIKKAYEIFHHESKTTGGRTDFQYGNTLIEYKKYNTLAKDKKLSTHQKQLQNYLKDNRFSGFTMFGFLFDGVQIYSYKKNEKDNINFDEKHSGKLNPQNLSFFISTIFQSGTRALSPINLKNDFGIIDKQNRLLENDEVISLAQLLFEKLKNTTLARTKLLFTEWEKLFRLAENDNGQHQDIKERREVFARIFACEITKDTEYQAFFALHTTLSVIIKLLLIRIISDKINIDDFYKSQSLSELKNFFTHLENGKYFSKVGISNLTDNDFFSWYVGEEFSDKFKIVQKIIFKICAYENIHIVKNTAMLDIFKELYQNFIPKCVRHSFGEYYTPYYLAEKTFLCATSGDKNAHHKSYIDPNCGSGTFLSVFFNHKHKNLKNKIDFAEFVKDIVGVDINPIAVIMARANILIQGLTKCTFNPLKKYEIPVYLADSLYVPNLIEIDNIPCLSYSLYTVSLQKAFNLESIKITLPKSLVEDENFLQIISEVEKHIINLDEKKAQQSFLKHINTQSKAIETLIKDCVKELIGFEKQKLNSIWLKIFSNYFRVATFESFDYIIGNPPWVQWSVLPEAYRQNTKANMRMDGLFSRDKNVGGNNLNLCALIANKCCERWLKDDGRFCFLMPKSILFNKSFEGFRNLIINNDEKMYFNEVVDFSNGGEIFEGVGIDFCAFKISKKPNLNEDIVPIIAYHKNTSPIHHNATWSEASNGFLSKEFFAVKLRTELNNNFLIAQSIERAKYLKSLIGKCEYQFRKGVSVPYAMRLVFIDFSKDKKRGIFSPYTKVGNRLKLDEGVKIELEFDFIRPFITAPMLNDEKAKQWKNDYCICAYEKGAKKPLKEDKLKTLVPYTYKYLKDIEYTLAKGSEFNKRVQSFDEFYGILRMGSYVWSENFICIRDNTKLEPTHFSLMKTHWDELKTPLFDNHISFISEVLNHKKHERYIDKREALYILEKLKNKDIQEIILNSQDNRSISSRLPVNIKLYNS